MKCFGFGKKSRVIEKYESMKASSSLKGRRRQSIYDLVTRRSSLVVKSDDGNNDGASKPPMISEVDATDGKLLIKLENVRHKLKAERAEHLKTLEGKLRRLQESHGEKTVFCCPDCDYKTGSQETLAFHIRISHPSSQKNEMGTLPASSGPRVVHPQLEVHEDGKPVSKLKSLLNAEVARRIERGELSPEDLKAPSAPPSGPGSVDSTLPNAERRQSVFSTSILTTGTASSFAPNSNNRRVSVFSNSGSEGSDASKKMIFDSSAEGGQKALARWGSATNIQKARRALQRTQSIRMDRASLRCLLKLDEADEPQETPGHGTQVSDDSEGKAPADDILALTNDSINGFSFRAGAKEKHSLF